MKIGERIKKRRKELELTVDEIANLLNKNRATIYRYENGDIENFPTTVLEPLAEVLKTTPAYLMGWEDNTHNTQSQVTNAKKIKNIILNRYGSIKKFAKIVDIPSTTLTSAFDRGIEGMAFDRVIKICDTLNINIKTFEPLTTNNTTLSMKENVLLNHFSKLNDIGKTEAIKRTEELTQIPKYTSTFEANVIAAHNDDTSEEQIRLMQKDLDEL